MEERTDMTIDLTKLLALKAPASGAAKVGLIEFPPETRQAPAAK